jgi:pimeloyl-ACP methyl ester carboxylesterase
MSTLSDWEARGRYFTVDGHRLWALDVPAVRDAGNDPLLVLHGYPSCSYDWHLLLDNLCAERRVVFVDFLGFGLSDKPDLRYSIRMHADLVVGVVQQIGLTRVALLTHDMGDTVGGELLHRTLDGSLALDVTRRVLTNGSVYINMAQLSTGQQLLLSLDDAPTELVNEEGFKAGLAATFSPASKVDDDELDAQWEFAAHNGGERLMARTIRYIEDRRKEERRYTGAIETHPSPLGVVWGADDPIAVLPMTETLRAARSDAQIAVLDDVGHYPMIEAPERFATAILQYL